MQVACGSSAQAGVSRNGSFNSGRPPWRVTFYGHYNLGLDRSRDSHIGSLPRLPAAGPCAEIGRGARGPPRGGARPTPPRSADRADPSRPCSFACPSVWSPCACLFACVWNIFTHSTRGSCGAPGREGEGWCTRRSRRTPSCQRSGRHYDVDDVEGIGHRCAIVSLRFGKQCCHTR